MQGDGEKSSGTTLKFWTRWNSAFSPVFSSLLSQRSLLLTLGHCWLPISHCCMADLAVS